MTTQTTFFISRVRVHLFNGYAEVAVVGVVTTDDSKALPEETIIAIIQLGTVLRPIYKRLIASGYSFVDGRMVKPEQLEQKV